MPFGECPVWNVIHPRLVLWSSILSSLWHSGLKFTALPQHEWVKVLRASPIDEVSNPSRKLLTIFENKYGQEELAMRYPLLTVQTEKASESLRSAPIADDGLVGGCMERNKHFWLEADISRICKYQTLQSVQVSIPICT